MFISVGLDETRLNRRPWVSIAILVTCVLAIYLAGLIQQVLAGKEVVIGKAGVPVARLVPFEQKREPRLPGALRGKIQIAADFDSLPDDIAEAFGAKAP